MGDSFGHLFRITTWGESHGGGVGVVIDGCPAGLEISESEIQYELDRRRPGQSKITTQRKESDSARILSGIFEGKTTGTAISIMVENQDARPQAYEHLKDLYRPSHADYTYEAKYGFRNWMGGGRASARETIGRVAAGALAKKLLKQWNGTQTLAWVEQIHDLKAMSITHRSRNNRLSKVSCAVLILQPQMPWCNGFLRFVKKEIVWAG